MTQKGAAVWRAATKASGLSQREIAQSLSISQSHVSKIANGLTVPSAPEWLEFARLTHISERSYLEGYIDRGKPIQVTDSSRIGSFRIPERYSVEKSSSVRMAQLYLGYLKNCIGPEKTEEFVRHLGLDPDYLTNYDHSLNVRFNLDVLEYTVKEGLLTAKDVERFSLPIGKLSFHGAIREIFASTSGPFDVMEKFCEWINRYEVNHTYSIENKKSRIFDISIVPNERMNRFLQPDLQNFFVLYFRYVLLRFLQLSLSFESLSGISILDKKYKAGEKIIYRIFHKSS